MDNSSNYEILKSMNLCSDIYKNYKTNILQQLIDENKDLAPQGSPEWLAIREYNIGGSEMSIITGENCFSKIDSLVAQKTGFIKFNGNLACRWGKMFEVITQRLTEIILNIDTIHETGSLKGVVPHQRYSPDGLGIVKLNCEAEFGDEMIETKEYCIVLFEYKSPFSSVPSGFIPKHYLPQVKTGLCSIPLADFAIFINNLYRKCSMQDLNETIDYHKEFHTRDKKFIPENTLALGVNIFYQTKEQSALFINTFGYMFKNNSDNSDEHNLDELYDSDDSNESNEDNSHNIFNQISNYQKPKSYSYYETPNIHKYIENIITSSVGESIHIRDFGKSYYTDFNNLMELYDKGFLSIYYCEPYIFDEYYNDPFLVAQNKSPKSQIDSRKWFKKEIDLSQTIYNYKQIIENFNNGDKKIIGYMPWKLFKSDIIYQGREPNYIKKYEANIQKTINIIKDINTSSTEDVRISKFKKYFPKSKILKECGLDVSDAFEFLPKNI